MLTLNLLYIKLIIVYPSNLDTPEIIMLIPLCNRNSVLLRLYLLTVPVLSQYVVRICRHACKVDQVHLPIYPFNLAKNVKKKANAWAPAGRHINNTIMIVD